MTVEAPLREKLRKIEALFARAGTLGERLAAEARWSGYGRGWASQSGAIRRWRCNSR